MIDRFKNANRYDILLVLMMALMAFGSSFGFFQPIRILHIVLIPVMLYDLRVNRSFFRKYRWELIFFAFWVLWAAVSLIWRTDTIECGKLFVHLCIYTCSFFEVLWLASRAQHPIMSVLCGWLVMFIATIPVDIWELITDHHLPTCDTQACILTYIMDHVAIRRFFAAATFDNLNAYNNVLCYLILPVCIWIFRARHMAEKVFGYAIFVILSVIIYENGSRASFACLLAAYLLFIILADTWRRRVAGGVILALIVTWFMLNCKGVIPQEMINTDHYYVELVQQGKLDKDQLVIVDGRIIGIRWDDRTPSKGSTMSARVSTQNHQDLNRKFLYTTAWQEFLDSHLMGIGIGNIPYAFQMHNKRYAAPHCLWLEILMEFGIFIFLGFLCLLLRVFIRGLLSHDRRILQASLIGLMLIVGATFSDGTMLFKAPLWMYLATLYVFSDKELYPSDNELYPSDKELNQ